MRTGFAELRSGLLRFGGELMTPFLRLDGEIEHFETQIFTCNSGRTTTVSGGTC
jgi:hypothetical protein